MRTDESRAGKIPLGVLPQYGYNPRLLMAGLPAW
jgi:hypothetical protein